MSFFASVFPSRRRPSDALERLKTYHTVTGKPLWSPGSTDVFKSNTLPPLVVLNVLKPEEFTDDKGRLYWKVSDFEAMNWVWDKAETIRKDASVYNAKTDVMYFIRNSNGNSLLKEHPPEVDKHNAMTFYSRGTKQVYKKGFIVGNGYDEMWKDAVTYGASEEGKEKVRDTSYVIVRWI